MEEKTSQHLCALNYAKDREDLRIGHFDIQPVYQQDDSDQHKRHQQRFEECLNCISPEKLPKENYQIRGHEIIYKNTTNTFLNELQF